jgi:RNA polymerase sigma-70 factor (ECF subfamily)
MVGMMPATSEPPWEELHGNLRAFVARRVRNQSDVDDLVQRVLLQIVKGLGTLRDSERLHAWVYRTARNILVDYYRSASARREVPSGGTEDLDAAEPSAARSPVPEEDERAALQELASCMTPMLRQLTPAYREAITLADLEGLNQAKAAERAGVSISGMKSRIQRGRKQLRAALETCCRIQLDRRGAIVAYDPRSPDSCRCDGCD